MVKISVLLPTYRYGGLDISFHGLHNQTFPKDEYEVILVDVYYDQRKNIVKDFIKEMGYDIPLKHMKPRWSTFPLDSGSMHRNSAIVEASGELCIFLCDYGYTHPDWLQKHWTEYQARKPTTMMAPHRYWYHPELRTDEIGQPMWFFQPISIFKELWTPDQMKEQTPPGTQDPKLGRGVGPVPGNHFHMKNEAFKLDTVLAINGCDEEYDTNGGHLYSDTDLGERLERNGNPFACDPTNIVEIIQIRDVYPHCLWQRSFADTKAYFDTRQLSGAAFAPNGGKNLKELWEGRRKYNADN